MKKILLLLLVLSFQPLHASRGIQSSTLFVQKFPGIMAEFLSPQNHTDTLILQISSGGIGASASITAVAGVGATIPNATVLFVSLVSYAAATDAWDQSQYRDFDIEREYKALGDDSLNFIADGERSTSLDEVLERTHAVLDELVFNEEYTAEFLNSLNVSEAEMQIITESLEDLKNYGVTDFDIASVIYLNAN